jgi:hypothetical protein
MGSLAEEVHPRKLISPDRLFACNIFLHMKNNNIGRVTTALRSVRAGCLRERARDLSKDKLTRRIKSDYVCVQKGHGPAAQRSHSLISSQILTPR